MRRSGHIVVFGDWEKFPLGNGDVLWVQYEPTRGLGFAHADVTIEGEEPTARYGTNSETWVTFHLRLGWELHMRVTSQATAAYVCPGQLREEITKIENEKLTAENERLRAQLVRRRA